ncbi:MAG: NifB/NifX family molybdenum-iron cluster-binding protein [Lachnospiraceae bacterium]|nr:NifB/NifX family molybdenum-iron cluster-binding protein [Lachnospiraceae bacterium]
MRIAVAINNEDENTFWHFGHAERFKIYDVEDGKVTGSSYVMLPEGHGPDKLNGLINENVNVIIADGQGPRIVPMAHEAGIQTFSGFKGTADEAVQQYLNGTLVNDPSAERPCSDHC